MYLSDIGNTPVIGDDMDHSAMRGLFEPGLGRGLEPVTSKRPYEGLAEPFPLPTIPRSEWADRIEQAEKTKSRLIDLKKWRGFPSLNQQQTSYCWANGVVACLHYMRAAAGLQHVPLSPASVAAPIKNFRNVGGWGSEALKYIIEHGVAPQSDWPANAIDRQYVDKAKESRLNFKVTEWWELKPRNLDQLISCVLYGIPVAVGYNWWGHEVTAIGAVRLGADDFGLLIDNSWGTNWGTEGTGILKDSKMLPDEAVGPRVVTPWMGV